MMLLKRAAFVIAGQSPPSDEVAELQGGLPFLQGNAEFGNRCPAARWECNSAPKRARRGDVLVSVRAPVGAVNVADRDYGIGRGLAAIRPRAIHSGYLRWWLLSQASTLRSMATGTTFEAVTASDLGNLVIPVRPEWQAAIAAFLDKETAMIDALVDEQTALIRALRTRRAAVIHHTLMFNTGAPERRLGRMLTKLARPVPAGSEVVTAFRDGIVTGRSNRREEGFTFSDLEQGYQGVARGDLVFHGLDGFAGAVGVSDTDGRCSPVYHVCRPAQDVDVRFAALQLRALGAAGFLDAYAWSVRQRSVDYRNWRLLAALPVGVPPLQNQISLVGEILESHARIDDALAKTQRHIELAQERRSALITAAVTGQIDVGRAA